MPVCIPTFVPVCLITWLVRFKDVTCPKFGPIGIPPLTLWPYGVDKGAFLLFSAWYVFILESIFGSNTGPLPSNPITVFNISITFLDDT